MKSFTVNFESSDTHSEAVIEYQREPRLPRPLPPADKSVSIRSSINQIMARGLNQSSN